MQLLALLALTLAPQLAAQLAPATSATPADSPLPVAAQTSEDAARVRSIEAGQSQRWKISQRAGRLSQIAVAAGRARGLALYLFDANGKLLASDTDASDGLGFGVRPGWEGPFTLVVRNQSRQDNLYRLMVE